MPLFKRSQFLLLALGGKAVDLIVTFTLDPTLGNELNPVSVQLLNKSPFAVSLVSLLVATAIGLFCTFVSLRDVKYDLSQRKATSDRSFSFLYQLYGVNGLNLKLLYRNVRNWRLFSYLLSRFSLFLLICTSLTTSLMSILLVTTKTYLSNELFMVLFLGFVSVATVIFFVKIEKVVRRDFLSRESA